MRLSGNTTLLPFPPRQSPATGVKGESSSRKNETSITDTDEQPLDADGWSASREGSASGQSEHRDEPGSDDRAAAHARLEWLGAPATARFETANSSTSTPAVDSAFRNEFAALAEDPDGFHSLMQSVYGENYNRGEAESLRQRALVNDFGWLPSVEYVDAATLNGGQAAYDTASATIFINRELQGTALGGQYFIEEVGHHLDAQLNTSDTAGDEGEVFQRLLAGEELECGGTAEPAGGERQRQYCCQW